MPRACGRRDCACGVGRQQRGLALLSGHRIGPRAVTTALGIDFASKQVLRLGVALLGLQISAAAFHVLNLASVADLAFNVAAVLFAGGCSRR